MAPKLGANLFSEPHAVFTSARVTDLLNDGLDGAHDAADDLVPLAIRHGAPRGPEKELRAPERGSLLEVTCPRGQSLRPARARPLPLR